MSCRRCTKGSGLVHFGLKSWGIWATAVRLLYKNEILDLFMLVKAVPFPAIFEREELGSCYDGVVERCRGGSCKAEVVMDVISTAVLFLVMVGLWEKTKVSVGTNTSTLNGTNGRSSCIDGYGR